MTTIDIEAGTSAQLDFQCTSLDGTVVDITGATFNWYAYLSPTDETTPALSKNGTVTDGPAGEVSVQILPVDTSTWSYRVLHWEGWLNLSGGLVYMVDSGKLIVNL